MISIHVLSLIYEYEMLIINIQFLLINKKILQPQHRS